MNIKKYFNLIFWITLAISCNALGIINYHATKSTETNNINNTGIIVNQKYLSNVNHRHKTITTYNYREKVDNSFNSSITNQNDQAKMLFAIVPKTIETIELSSFYTSKDKILQMNIHLYDCSILKNSVLNSIELYIPTRNLEIYFNTKQKTMLIDTLQGSDALFIAENIEPMLESGVVEQTLTLGVTALDDLLLKTSDFNPVEINQEEIAILQKQILEAAAHTKTIIFIPKCISLKASGKLRLPFAIINTVILNPEDQTITLNLLFNQNAENNSCGLNEFIKARNSLITAKEENTDEQWEFIDYSFKVIANNDCFYYANQNYYNFDNARVNPTGNIQQHSIIPSYEPANNNQKCETASINLVDEVKSPCKHYKRKCLVKLSCCDKYFPCHKCHNQAYENFKSSNTNLAKYLSCDPFKKARSKDAIKLKCLKCDTEQEFNSEGSQYFCQECHLQLAEYYCGICKHFAGVDKSPYHCNKCGICRIHGNRSYHCDACGICLDVVLKNNHKCRPGSEHDGCVICAQDAFSGCQILPCSHKIHKECAKQMIASGATKCPVCSESFAHRLTKKKSS